MNKHDQCLWKYYQNDNAGVFSGTHDRHNKVVREIKKRLPLHAKVLEVGFGDGYLIKKLSNKYDCYGADISNEVVERIKKEILNVRFETINIDGKLPYEDNFFNGFIASEVLEHMADEELFLCVSEIKRVLKKDGYGIITVPAEENLKESECFCPNCGTVFHKWGHKQFWDVKKIRDVFKGFEIIQIKDYFVRYEGNSVLEKITGYIFYILRNLFNKFNKLPNRSYLAVIRKK